MAFLLGSDWKRLEFQWNLEERLLESHGIRHRYHHYHDPRNIHASCSNFDVIKLALALLGKPTCAGI